MTEKSAMETKELVYIYRLPLNVDKFNSIAIDSWHYQWIRFRKKIQNNADSIKLSQAERLEKFI